MTRSLAPRIALYPGTFDPLTCGHLDLIERAHLLFDQLIVGVAYNERKSPLFTVEERLALLRESTQHMGNVECRPLEGLTVRFAHAAGAQFIIRGLRAVSDFEFELQMAIMNREMAPAIETLFLAPAAQYIFLSSSVVKEVWRHGGDISPFVPPAVMQAFEKIRDRKVPPLANSRGSVGGSVQMPGDGVPRPFDSSGSIFRAKAERS